MTSRAEGAPKLGGRNVRPSVKNLGGDLPATCASELMHCELVPGWMRIDGSELQWLTAFRTRVVHKKIQRHSSSFPHPSGVEVCAIRNQ
jgi:hypothetical protein